MGLHSGQDRLTTQYVRVIAMLSRSLLLALSRLPCLAATCFLALLAKRWPDVGIPCVLLRWVHFTLRPYPAHGDRGDGESAKRAHPFKAIMFNLRTPYLEV